MEGGRLPKLTPERDTRAAVPALGAEQGVVRSPKNPGGAARRGAGYQHRCSCIAQGQ